MTTPLFRAVVACGLAIGLAGCIVDTGTPLHHERLAANNEPYRALARHWAPRIYQDTDTSNQVADYITNFNFDGDYNGKNNWENLERFPTVAAYVYYAVSETETHYFVHYALFHPRDWHEWLAADMHENDLEGISLAIEKDGSFGRLVAMETMAHDQFYQYRAVPEVEAGSETVDGEVQLFDKSHPRIFVEAKGHGVYACDGRCDRAPGGDGIIYAEAGGADSPDGPHGNFERVYAYSLIAFDADGRLDGNQGFWYRRRDICDTCTFGSWGRLRGDNYGTDRAKLAWAWDDADDGEVYAGAMLCDPALFFDVHLDGSAFEWRFSHQYVTHEYFTHRLDVYAVRSRRQRSFWEGYPDVYVQVTASESPQGSDTVLDASGWKRDEAAAGVWYDFSRGADQATGQRKYAMRFGSHHYCRPDGAATTFAVYDSDSTTDELMGTTSTTASAYHADGLQLRDAELRFDFDVR